MKSIKFPTPLENGLMFSDIHFGKKGNSSIHNNDCLDFINFVCDYVKENPEIDYIAFLGDWHESRVNVHIDTLKFSSDGVEMLTKLDIPIFLVVGNHDMLTKNSRLVHSLYPYRMYKNVYVIDEITKINAINGDLLLVPFLLRDEYDLLSSLEALTSSVWAGHFEFNNFVVTGYNITMQGGSDHKRFKHVKNILSGHFHKRQQQDNVTYIGNTFPMDFGDAGDTERGFIIYNHNNHAIEFHDWTQCPKYQKIKLSEFDNNTCDEIKDNVYLQCIIDKKVNFEELLITEDMLKNGYNIREINLIDNSEIDEILHMDVIDSLPEDETNSSLLVQVANSDHLLTVDQQVVELLSKVRSEQLSTDKLIQLYCGSQ